MTVFNPPDEDKEKIQMRKRIVELESINQNLHNEILKCKHAESEVIKLRDKLEVEVRNTKILHTLSTRYIQGSNSDLLFEEIIEAAIAITRADKGNIQICDPSTGKLKIAAQRGFDLPFLDFFESVDAGDKTACGTAMERMERVVIEDITQNSTFLGRDVLNILLNEEVRAVQSTPLISRSGQFVGILSTHFSQVHTPAERELTLIDVLARQAADIVERMKAEKTIKESEKRQAFLLKLSDTLRLLTDPIEIQYQAARILGEHLGANRVGYAEAQEDGETVVVTRNYANGVPGIEGRYRYDDYGPELLREFRAGRTVVRSDIAGDPTLTDVEKEAHSILQLGATVNVPLMKANRLVAVLFMHHREAHAWSAEELALLEAVAERTWEAVERARAEEALHESEEKYRMLFNSIDQGFFLIDVIFDENDNPVDMFYVESNATATRMLGKDFTGKRLKEINPDYESSYWYEIFGKVARTGQSIRMEQYVDPDKKWYSFYVFKIGGQNSRRVGSIFLDITERKRTEEELVRYRQHLEELVAERTAELEASETKFRRIVETAGEGIWITDPEAITTFVNQRMAEMLGYTKEEMIGKSAINFADKEDIEDLFVRMKARQAEIKEKRYEIKLYRKDGSIVWSLASTTPLFDAQGNNIGNMGMYSDITERKQLEEQIRQRVEELEMIMDVAPVAIFIGHDPQGRNITGNKKANEYSKAEAGENIADITNVRRFFHKGHELTVKELPVQKAALENTDVRNVEIDYMLPNGERKVVLGSASPLHDAEGHVRGSVGAFIDITERKQTEETMSKIEAARQKEIHHRIKNNLQVISSLLDLQAEKFCNRKCIEDSEVFEAFRESQDRVMSIALIHAELHEGGGNNTLNFSLYLQRLVASLFQTYRLGNLDIKLNADLEEDILLDMDTAVPLGMIVNEIVSNSLKHAFPGKKTGEIRIKLFSEEAKDRSNEEDLARKNARYTLIFSDNGVGIPKDIDLENSETLGLQLINILVDQLDGEIELKRNYGTEFIIRFNIEEKKD